MTNDRKDEAPAGSAEEWPKRAGPTIDLAASDVSGDTQASGGNNPSGTFFRRVTGGLSAVLPILAALIGGAVAALLVLAAFWTGGLIGEQQAAQPAVSLAQFDNVAANVGDLTARVARVESAAAKPPPPAPALVPDPTLAGRTEAVERSLVAVREEVGRVNGQLRTITSSLNELKTMPRDGAVAAAPDLGPLNERLKQLEDATRTLAADRKGAADDINVRRLVAANTLDAAVRRGEPFAAALAVAKQVTADPSSLSPLDAFAARGIPAEATYLREIVPVLQRLADGNAAKTKSAGAESSTGAGILDRLQSGVTKLVRIERDTGPTAAPPASASPTAVRREDLAATRKDVANLPQAADPQIQAWLKSVDAREAALAAAQKFSAEALAAFGKSGQ